MSCGHCVSDGSASQPRLRLQCSKGLLQKIRGSHGAAELPGALDELQSLGFGGVEGDCDSEGEAMSLADLLRERSLGLGYSCSASDEADLAQPIALARLAGADYLVVRVEGWLLTSGQILKKVKKIVKRARDAGLPLLIRTEPRSATHDLRRTASVAERYGKIRYALDATAYLLPEEIEVRWAEDLLECLQDVAWRSTAFVARLPEPSETGQGVPEAYDSLHQLRRLWASGIQEWLDAAEEGDVLPFTCDLAAHWRRRPRISGGEQLREQLIMMKGLIEQAWAEGQTAHRACEDEQRHV